MNIEQLEKGLLAKFSQSRVVFWQDSDSEFTEQLTELNLKKVELVLLDEVSHFAIKRDIELLRPTQSFLLYSVSPQPEVTRDWLFDIRLYSETFYADSSSMILNELGMRMEFRQLIGRYKNVFCQQAARAKN